MLADPVTQYGEAVMGAARISQHGDRDRDGDEQNNQSNDDKHVDASDPGAGLQYTPYRRGCQRC
ncbi:hypothetical protein [Mycobacterium sp.]|uniref:hypothetical protein n=1 Tax=Mycobacterium sp. TaxID=1785 RepID=UPI002D0300F0|nr:hypothetical protein [Mycobacterium sp.]HME47275.1 hypothetical protein [Mycobacterium sp.]